MGYVVCHATKYTSSNINSGAMSRHIDRECNPENAISENSHLNFELCEKSGKLQKLVNDRIEEGYKGKKKIRDNAVRDVGVILSGSHEVMKEIEKKGLIKQWAYDSYKFFANEIGEENIVKATVHLDEKTPHMHLHFVPLTKDGRLSAKEILTKDKLQEWQSGYAFSMDKYGLQRGVNGSKRKHVTTNQFSRWLNANDVDAQKIVDAPKEKAVSIVSTMLQQVQIQQEQELIRNLENQPQSKPKRKEDEREISKPTGRRKKQENQRPKRGGYGL